MEKWRIFIFAAVGMLLIVYGLWIATNRNRSPRSTLLTSVSPQPQEELI